MSDGLLEVFMRCKYENWVNLDALIIDTPKFIHPSQVDLILKKLFNEGAQTSSFVCVCVFLGVGMVCLILWLFET
jgi:hypothetical protein